VRQRESGRLGEDVGVVTAPFRRGVVGRRRCHGAGAEYTFANFRLVFDRRFLDTVIGRTHNNEEIVRKVLDDQESGDALMEMHATRVYRRAREVD
jgi:hypothetical protein